jgi:DNA polymerase-1
MPPILYLIDGHALAYRSYFALSAAGGGRWQTRSGEPTAGIYGFASTLLRLLEQEKPEYLAVAFDTGKTFRNEIFPDYKATRAKMPDDLRPQIERIRQMIDAFNLPHLEMEGFEGDDVLGSIAHQAAAQGFGVKIITGDKDLLQLVNDRIIVNLPGSKLTEAKDYTAEGVRALLGVSPNQVVDYKALVGDTSDNIPGVAGIGQKTAITLFEKYPTLDMIYSHLDDLPASVRAKLAAGYDSALMSRTLAAIRTDLQISLDLDKARTEFINYSAVEEIFRQLEFRSLIDRLKTLSGESSSPAGKQQLSLFGEVITRIGQPGPGNLNVHIVNTSETLQSMLTEFHQAPVVALDTETTSTDPLRASLVGISFSVREGEAYYIPIGHRTGEKQLQLDTVTEALSPFLSDFSREWVGHNIKYDSLVLAQHGLKPGKLGFDTMIAGWLLDPASHRLGLKDMAESYLNISMTHIEDLIGKGKKQTSMADVTVEKAAPYAAADAEVTLRLRSLLERQLKEQNALHLLTDIEMPLVPVLIDMEEAGIALDIPFFSRMSAELQQRIAELQTQVQQSVGYSFNLNSTQQLSKALFEKLSLEPPDRRKKTMSGHFSTSADVLEQLVGKHPVIECLLEYRELSKLKSTYVDTLPLEINPKTGRVHTSFNQTGSVTGRLASSDPNLQNIPTRTEIGQRVRQGFIAEKGHVLLSVDYSQIELRIVAHMSGDEAMLNAFRAGQDIHSATAAAVFGVPLENVTKEQRRHAKSINFGLIYGMSAFGLSNTTGLTLGESEDFVRAYFRQFPGVKSYLDNLRRMASSQGYVETLLGRRRFFPNLKDQSNINVRNREEREAINAPIQGTAADIMKLAMIQLPGRLAEKGLKTRLLLQVHDELILECPEEELSDAIPVVKIVMENAHPISIPLITDVRWGKNWGSLIANQ